MFGLFYVGLNLLARGATSLKAMHDDDIARDEAIAHGKHSYFDHSGRERVLETGEYGSVTIDENGDLCVYDYKSHKYIQNISEEKRKNDPDLIDRINKAKKSGKTVAPYGLIVRYNSVLKDVNQYRACGVYYVDIETGRLLVKRRVGILGEEYYMDANTGRFLRKTDECLIREKKYKNMDGYSIAKLNRFQKLREYELRLSRKRTRIDVDTFYFNSESLNRDSEFRRLYWSENMDINYI